MKSHYSHWSTLALSLCSKESQNLRFLFLLVALITTASLTAVQLANVAHLLL